MSEISKVYTDTTYMYHNFITLEEQEILKAWAYSIEDKLEPNLGGPNRKFNRLDRLGELPSVIDTIRKRILEHEDDIKVVAEAPQNGDWIGMQGEGAFVEPHRDHNGTSYYFYTRRYNLLISMPQFGGIPIHANEQINVKERTLWRCEAGLIVHATTPNVGDNKRINLSFGFSMPIDTQLTIKNQ